MTGPIRVRKLPVEVDAYQYYGVNADDVAHWVGPNAYITLRGELIIRTLEGDHRADPGDWIIQGVKGEFYPIKPDIFDETYEPVG